ncbi:TPA: DUF6932 family protein [Bacillus cereus]
MKFNEDGLLNPGDYPMTIAELRNSLLVEGPTDEVPWDKEKRLMLVNNLETLVNQLHQVGVNEIFIDGSFVEDKASPSDIDGYFDVDVRTLPDLIRELNAIDPYKVWNWKDRIYDRNSAKHQLGMWHRYRVELYPNTGQGCGIRDEYGNEQTFPAAFRKTRDTFLPKGIIKIIK